MFELTYNIEGITDGFRSVVAARSYSEAKQQIYNAAYQAKKRIINLQATRIG